MNEKKLNDVFYLFDRSNTGYMENKDIGIALRSLGIFISEKDLQDIKKTYNKINLDGFTELYNQKLSQNKSVNDIIEAFKFFDPKNTGKVNIYELKHGLQTIGEPINEEDFQILIEEFTPDSEGFIDYKNFANSITNTNN